jgi:hypothetical protein
MKKTNIYLKPGTYIKSSIADGEIQGISLEEFVVNVINNPTCCPKVLLASGVSTDLIPSIDNVYTLGNSNNRWKTLYLGEGTLYITDTVTGLDAALTVSNGTLFVNGVSLMSVAGVKFADNTIQTTAFNPTRTSFNARFQDSTGTTAGISTRAYYTLVGKLCYFRVYVDFTNCTNFGTGQYQITLPFRSAETMRQAGGTFHLSNPSGTVDGTLYHIAGITDIAISDTIHKFYYSGGTTDAAWKNNTPVAITATNTHFDISGVYEIV